MNYIKCFNRSRAAICLQPVFLSSWCLHSGTDGVLRPCAICARPGASMLARMEYYAPCAICARPGASMLARMEYYAPCAICARPGASILARMEYYVRVPFAPVLCLHAGTDGVLRPVPFAPVLVPTCWHGWSITPRAICARPGAPTPSYYIHYGISQILGTLHRCPLLAAHYRLYRASRILGNCKQM